MKERLTLLDAVRAAVPSRRARDPRHRRPAAGRERRPSSPSARSTTVPMRLSRCRPTTATCGSSTRTSRPPPGTFPVLAYHYPKVSLNDGIADRRAAPAPHRRAQGLDRRSDPHARAARGVRRPRLQRLRGDGALRRRARLHRRDPRRRQPRARARGEGVRRRRRGADVRCLDAHRIASFDSPHGLKGELHARYGTSPHCRHHHA